MKYLLSDLVFQNDRYYLLFDDLEAIKIPEIASFKRFYHDDVYLGDLKNCNISTELSIDSKVVLETKDNLNALENRFRKLKNVWLSIE